MTLSIDKFAHKLNYQFNDISHLELALTHRSASGKHNERSEFLGDSILNFVIAEDLYNQFPKATEGELSRYRAILVRKETLAEIARELNIGDFIQLGSGELKSGGYRRDSILADALEAVFAAVLLDSGFDAAKKTILSLYQDRISNVIDKQLKDPKSRLQEYLQSRKQELPQYTIVSMTGDPHDQMFTIECWLANMNMKVTASGKSRRNAEQAAAKLLLKQIETNK